MSTVTVVVDRANFAKGVKYAKQMGGRFNPSSKTWAIPADRPELGAIRAYGLIRVEDAPAPRYRRCDECGSTDPRHDCQGRVGAW